MAAAESALVVLVPEADALVRPFRDRHDPSAAAGMPAHVTLLYPFRQPASIDEAALVTLRQCLAGIAPFRCALTAAKRLADDVLYLAPEPAEPFRQLALALWHRFPDAPPYRGDHVDIVPHLTIAQLADRKALDAVAGAFDKAAEGKLPIAVAVGEIALMDNTSGRWEIRHRLPLGG